MGSSRCSTQESGGLPRIPAPVTLPNYLAIVGCLAIAACAVLPAALAGPAESVAVAAGADPDYVQGRAGGGSPAVKSQSYVMAQGSFFGGCRRDASLERMKFTDIAQILGKELATQRYYPAADKKAADLLIVVHWGITSVEEDATHGQTDLEQLNRDVAAYNKSVGAGKLTDPGAMNADIDMLRGESAATGSSPAANAKLLGYDGELQKEEYRSLATASGMTEMDRRLREEIADERYFLIVMAYDYTSVKGGRKGFGPKLLWSTHYSIRAAGHSFTAAFPEMTKVAARYFGRNVQGLLLDAGNIPEGRVEIGEPKTVDDAKAK